MYAFSSLACSNGDFFSNDSHALWVFASGIEAKKEEHKEEEEKEEK